RVVAVGAPEAAGLTSHGALGLTRATRGLAIAFDAGEPGEARVQLRPEGLEAASEWLPTRPLRPEGDASDAAVIRPSGRRPDRATRPVRPFLSRRSGPAGAGGGTRGLVLAAGAGGKRQ